MTYASFRRLTLLILMTAALCSLGQQANTPKQPWQWTVDERIAQRCDRMAARARVERARSERVAPTVVRKGRVEWHDTTDVIIGKQSPQLLLPTEVFESVVRNGFLVPGWREAYAGPIAASGLPATFWEQLESVSALYIDDLRQQSQVTPMDGPAESRLCADRADALARARVVFGSALDVFMYRHIAPTKSLDMDHLENPAALTAREEGCR